MHTVTHLHTEQFIFSPNRTEYGVTQWFKIRKETCQRYTVSSYLFSLYAEHTGKTGGEDRKLKLKLLEIVLRYIVDIIWVAVRKT